MLSQARSSKLPGKLGLAQQLENALRHLVGLSRRGQAMLAQANQVPQGVLQLLG